MRKIHSFLCLFVILQYGFSQNRENASAISDAEPKLTRSTFSYPLFLDDEEHSSFLVRYRLSDKTSAELRTFYDTYRTTNRVRSNFRFKQYLNKKLYLYSGLEIEAEINKYPHLKQQPPRVGLINGLGYEVNKSFVIEGGSNIQVNNSPMGVFGERDIPMPQVYTLGGKIKF